MSAFTPLPATNETHLGTVYIEDITIWMAPPGRWRFEIDLPTYHLRAAKAHNGTGLWLDVPSGSPMTATSDSICPYEHYFRASSLLDNVPSIHLNDSAAGRSTETWLLEARGAEFPPELSVPGADRVRMTIESIHDVVVSLEGLAGSDLLYQVSAREVQFDRQLDAHLFERGYPPSRGEGWIGTGWDDR